MPQRIQLSRAKGWRMPPGAVKVDRTTKWGNPFPADGDQAAAVDRYRRWLAGTLPDEEFAAHAGRVRVRAAADREAVLAALPELRGRDLACWCKPGTPCHVDVLLELANAPATGGF
ncbi:DUF4326 domain-containing protein [Azospirillum sp. ST 5-10]|uniref:DUF4326 domain-containing protein n=1 Tax=unclassified Azospirillum TaxID=2630922 RepID=UPI003F4A4BB4